MAILTPRGTALLIGEQSSGSSVSRTNGRPLISGDAVRGLIKSTVDDLYVSGAGSPKRHTSDREEVSLRVSLPASYSRIGMLLKHMIGSVSTGAPSGGYYPHTYAPSALPTGLTAELIRGSGGSTSELINTAKVNSWSISSSARAPRAVLDIEFWAKTSTRPSAGSLSLGGNDDFLLHHQAGTVGWNSATYEPVSATISGQNNLERAYTTGLTVDELIEPGARLYSAQFDFYDLGDDDFYDALHADTRENLTWTFTSGSLSWAWTLRNAYVVDISNPFRGASGVQRTVRFGAEAGSSNEALELVVTNQNSSGTAN